MRAWWARSWLVKKEADFHQKYGEGEKKSLVKHAEGELGNHFYHRKKFRAK